MNKGKKTVIYFVRHGDFENKKKIIAGNLPLPLSKKGQIQIKKASELLSKRNISVIYSSPIKRTFESAQIISKFFIKIKVIKKRELRECELTNWTGKNRLDIIQSIDWEIYQNNPLMLRAGETFEKVSLRMEKFCRGLLKNHKGEELICVSHQDPIRTLNLRLKGKSLGLLHKIPCEKGSITGFYFNNNKLIKTKYFEPK